MKEFFHKIFFITGCYLLATSTCLQAQNITADPEQNNLQLCYTYSKLLNCEIDTLPNPALYQAIYEWLGTPYKYSGDCREGIDCSGFVCMLYQRVFGIELAQSSADIFKDVKPLKKTPSMKAILFFLRSEKKEFHTWEFTSAIISLLMPRCRVV